MARRKRAKDQTPRLWVEEGEQVEALIAEVAPALPVDRTYSFAVPDELATTLAVGQRVNVRVGRGGRAIEGFVLRIARGTWDTTLREIESVVDSESYLSSELIELARRIARHYAAPIARTLKAMIPTGVRNQSGMKTVRYARLLVDPSAIESAGRRIGPKQRALLEALAMARASVQTEEIRSNTPPSEEVDGANDDGEMPHCGMRVSALLARSGASAAVLRGSVKSGFVEILERREAGDPPTFDRRRAEPGFELNADQRAAVDEIALRIDAGGFSTTLVYGVSGSGKTEVYVHAIRRVLAAGRQAILLVPEIALTTQLVDRLATRFERVAVSHSGLTDAQRALIWRAIAHGDLRVVIGTRSAVFAPCANLGLIVVDEEQETSYKNLQAPRFHVRDVAIMRAHHLGIPIVLGSATPSLETWHNCHHRSSYHLVTLPRRANDRAMPEMHVVAMQDEYREARRTVLLSQKLIDALRDALRHGRQGMILMNRRGYARRIHCPECKARIVCPHCNVPLVVHAASDRAICHYCRTRVAVPTTCPNVTCGARLVQHGAGTERVEKVLAAAFPDARIQRVDSDTMRHRDQYRRLIDDFAARRIDVLVGTQMIAKGLDFPHVSFVGVIDADAGGAATDFRAYERLFQLVTQVAGRAGRADEPGTVVVQTMDPDCEALKRAVAHDYEGFAVGELESRRRAGLPPFSRLVRIVVAHQHETRARERAESLADDIKAALTVAACEAADVLGPTPCPLARLRGKYRYDLLIRTRSVSDQRSLMKHLGDEGKLRSGDSSLIVDVDPVDMG